MHRSLWIAVGVISVCALLLLAVGLSPSAGEQVGTPAPTVNVMATVTTTTTTTTIAPTTTTTTLPPPPDKLSDPLLEPPTPPATPCTYYNDAAFIGDSVSEALRICAANGELGQPVFLTKVSYSIYHAAHGTMLLNYNGEQMAPEDALAAAGVKKVFMMLGTNDIGAYGIERTLKNWETVTARIRETCPDITIYIQSCTPIYKGGEKGALNNKNMDAYNLRLKAFAEEHGYRYVDIAAYFKDGYGGMAQRYTSDEYVHLNGKGVTVWINALRVYAETASE